VTLDREELLELLSDPKFREELEKKVAEKRPRLRLVTSQEEEPDEPRTPA